MNTTFFANNKTTNVFSFNTGDVAPAFSIAKSPGEGVWNFNSEKIITGNDLTPPAYVFTGAGPVYNIKLYSDSFDKIDGLFFSAFAFVWKYGYFYF